MRSLYLALLLAGAGQAATIIPVVTATLSDFPTTLASNTLLMNDMTATFTVGPGGAIVTYNISVQGKSAQLSSPRYGGSFNSSVTVIGGFGYLQGISGNYTQSTNDASPFSNGLCCNVSLDPGVYTVDASVKANVGPVGTDSATVVSQTAGFASLSLIVISGNVVVNSPVPEPGAWALSGLGILAAIGRLLLARSQWRLMSRS